MRCGDAPDRNDRNSTRSSHRSGKATHPCHGVGVCLGLGREHRAKTQVVGAARYSRDDLRQIVRRHSDPQAALTGRHYRLGIGERKVGLPEVDAVGATGQRDIEAVIDDQRGTVPIADSTRHPANLHQLQS